MPLALPPEQGSLEIIVQPMSSLRFRYQSEAGKSNILGQGEKPCPEIRVHGYRGQAKVYASLVTVPETNEERPKPHPHRLDGSGCEDGIFSKSVTITDAMDTIKFEKLNLLSTRSKDWKEELTLRESKKIDPFRTGYDHKDRPKEIDRNYVAICFQMVIRNVRKKVEMLQPVCSSPIAHSSGKRVDFEIAAISPKHGPRTGKKRMILLMNGINRKGDVQKVRFFDEVTGWEGYGTFNDSHVHETAAIKLVYPEYDQELFPPKGTPVRVELITARGTTPSVPFFYGPEDPTKPKKERKIRSNAASADTDIPAPIADQQTNSNPYYEEVSRSLSLPSDPASQPLNQIEPLPVHPVQVQPEAYTTDELGSVPDTVRDLKPSLDSDTGRDSLISGSSLSSGGSLNSGSLESQLPMTSLSQSIAGVGQPAAVNVTSGLSFVEPQHRYTTAQPQQSNTTGQPQQGDTLIEPQYLQFNQPADHMMDTSTSNVTYVRYNMENCEPYPVPPNQAQAPILVITKSTPDAQTRISNVSLPSTSSTGQFVPISPDEFRQQNAAQEGASAFAPSASDGSASSSRYVPIQPKGAVAMSSPLDLVTTSSPIMPQHPQQRPQPRPVPKKRVTPPRPRDRSSNAASSSNQARPATASASNVHVLQPATASVSNVHVLRPATASTSNVHVLQPATASASNVHVLRPATASASNVHSFSEVSNYHPLPLSQILAQTQQPPHSQGLAISTANNRQQPHGDSIHTQRFNEPAANSAQQSQVHSVYSQGFNLPAANTDIPPTLAPDAVMMTNDAPVGGWIPQENSNPSSDVAEDFNMEAAIASLFENTPSNEGNLPLSMHQSQMASQPISTYGGASDNGYFYNYSDNTSGQQLLVSHLSHHSSDQTHVSSSTMMPQHNQIYVSNPSMMSQGNQIHVVNPSMMSQGNQVYVSDPSMMSQGNQIHVVNPSMMSQGNQVYVSDPSMMLQGNQIHVINPSMMSQGNQAHVGDPSMMSQGNQIHVSNSNMMPRCNPGQIMDSQMLTVTHLDSNEFSAGNDLGLNHSQPPQPNFSNNAMCEEYLSDSQTSISDLLQDHQKHAIIPPPPSSLPVPMFGTQPTGSQSNYTEQHHQGLIRTQYPPRPHVQLPSERRTSAPLVEVYRDPRSIRSSVSADESSPFPRSQRSQSTNSSSPHSNQSLSQESQESNGAMSMMTHSFARASSISEPPNPDSLDDLMEILNSGV